MALIMKNGTTGQVVQIEEGFSWLAFLVTPIWGLMKGVYLHAIIYIILAMGFIFHFGFLNLIYGIVAGIKATDWEKNALLKKGFKEVSSNDIKKESNNDLSRLEKLSQLKESGAISDEEFNNEKSKILKGE